MYSPQHTAWMGVLIVSPRKMPSISLPPFVRLKDFWQWPGGCVALETLDSARRQDQHAVCCLTTEDFLPGVGNNVELGEIERLGRMRPMWRHRSSSRFGHRAIQSACGTRTPDVVPFQVNTTSRAGSMRREIRQFAIVGLDAAHIFELQLIDDIVDPTLAESSPRRACRCLWRPKGSTVQSRQRLCRMPARCRSDDRQVPRRIPAG